MTGKISCRKSRLAALCASCAVAALASPALASESATETATAPSLAEERSAVQGQTYGPTYFAQFAPRSALDMVERIPGFEISGGNDFGQRGLGQATQNVIVNGERFSSKSDTLQDQLRRIPAGDVLRIEIVDGNSLDIPGLTGQVANVIYQSNGASGQFRWNTGFRPHNTQAQLYGGEVSITGKIGALDYTLALSNTNDRSGADGPTLITDGNGALIEEQYTKFSARVDNPKLATALANDFGGGVVANLNLSYGVDYSSRNEPEVASPASGPVRIRESKVRDNGPKYEISGDIQFPLGPGMLKLIALERYERDNFKATLIDSFADASPSTGFRFEQTNGAGERIGRFEYGWNMLGGDWQFSGEAAFNRLDRNSSLFELDPAGQFVLLDFPEGNGGVTEDRYETSLSFSRALSPSFSIQAIGSVEFSKIEQTGSAANSRSFRRPKGSIAATWKPNDRFDLSVTVARRVSQLSFGDFLASVSLNDNNQNGGNNDLVPYQSWNLEVQANRNLGPWGSIKLQARQAWFQDFTDWIPLANGGEARGNVGNARRLHLEANATINFDPIGWKGARLDIQAIKRYLHETDPFTGQTRGFSYDQEGALEIDFRHDIPSSDWAWGAKLSHYDQAPYARRAEEGREWEGTFFGSVFVEHKDVFGLTVQARAANLLGARNHFRRTVYDDARPDGDVIFHEYANRRIGPIFQFTVSGNF